MLPDANELHDMRASVEELALPDTCDVLALTRTSDGAGGWTEAWAVETNNVKCRLDYHQGRELVASGALQPFQGFTLTVPYDTTLTVQNRITHGGKTYTVQSVSGGSWRITKRAALELT